jgi:CheY-like chemotaxis protein
LIRNVIIVTIQGLYMRLLIVDDEIDILETIVESLEIEFDELDITIDKAINGLEALELIKDTTYDLVVTDLRMPKMDGLELSKRLNAEYSQIPIIVFTGHGDADELSALKEHGVKSMVKKPYVEKLIEDINQYIK